MHINDYLRDALLRNPDFFTKLGRVVDGDPREFQRAWVAEYWGEPCPDHDPDCPVCRAWASFDAGTFPPEV